MNEGQTEQSPTGACVATVCGWWEESCPYMERTCGRKPVPVDDHELIVPKPQAKMEPNQSTILLLLLLPSFEPEPLSS